MESNKNTYTPPRDFKSELNGIISAKLTPSQLLHYADHAIDQLVQLLEDTSTAYQREPTILFETPREIEDTASRYFDLPSVESILDHICGKEEEISSIYKQAAVAPEAEHVVLSPDPGATVDIQPADGTFDREMTSVPRTETIMFILANDFGVDLKDPEQFDIHTGKMPSSMMRKLSYKTIELPQLKRLIFVCNELNNKTFVLDVSAAEKLGISAEQLAHLSKPDLDTLIGESPKLGQSINYREDTFIPRITAAIRNPQRVVDDAQIKEAPDYLVPKAKEDELAISGLAKALGVTDGTIKNIIERLNLPGVGLRRFGARTTPAYDLNDRGIIRQALETDGLLADITGLFSAEAIGRETGNSPATVRKVISLLQGEGALDDPSTVVRKSGRYGSATWFGPGDHAKIRAKLEADGYIIPKHTRSVANMAHLLDIQNSSVEHFLRREGMFDDLPTHKRRGSEKRTPTLTIDKQLEILEKMHTSIRLKSAGRFSLGTPFIDDVTYERARAQLLEEKVIAEAEADQESAAASTMGATAVTAEISLPDNATP
jgi:biotin operon repressor